MKFDPAFTMGSLSSKVMLGVGIALAVGAIASIFITMAAAQSQSGQQSSQSSSSQSNQTQTSSSSNSTSGGGGTTGITIVQGASSQQTKKPYDPDPAQVQSGSKVTWQNKDSAPHTATADDKSFDTGNIQPGSSGSANVKGQGKVSYHCTIHPFMHGTLQIGGGGNGGSSSGGSQQQGSNQSSTQTASTGPSSDATSASSPSTDGSASSNPVIQALQQTDSALLQALQITESKLSGSSASTATTTSSASTSGVQQQSPNAQPQQDNQSLSSGPTGQTQTSSINQGTGGNSTNSTSNSSANSGNNNQSSASGSSTGGSSSNTIEIPQGAVSAKAGQYYKPDNAQVSAGKVTWSNKDSVPHTATADDNSFDTGNIQPGASGTADIKSSSHGKIPYHCTIHPWMKASLTIGSQSSGGSSSSNNNQTQTSSSGGGQQGQQPIRKTASANVLLPPTNVTTLGTEPEHQNDWVTTYHDVYGTRSSAQTIIGKNNVNQLQVKWIFHSDFPIESPALIVGDRAYAIDNAMRVFAIDANNGTNLWMFDPGVASQQSQQLPRGTFAHGITYDNGVIFAPTGANATVVALNATDGKLLWQSAAIGDPTMGYREPAPPIVWKNIVIAGSALGDEPPFGALQGRIVALNRTNGDMLWNMSTTSGAWVQGGNESKNGGGMIWSGGSLDPKAGILYVPTGNASPDFNDTGRPSPNLQTSSMIAVDVKTGHMLWATQFVTHDSHDWDTAWGSSVANVTTSNGASEKLVIGQTKRGELFALDASNGNVVWNDTIGVKYNIGEEPSAQGSGVVWPGTQYGVEDYHANDNDTVYAATSNMGFHFYVHGSSGKVVPAFDAIQNGVGNGTVVAIDMKTGAIKWLFPTEFPTWTSPAVTNGVVFSGHITATGTPYEANDFGAPTKTPLNPSGVIIALDKDTGKLLWQFNVGAPIGIGGPSVGDGMLLVTTGSPAEIGANKGGDIIAFGLPNSQAMTSAVNNNSSSVNAQLPSTMPQAMNSNSSSSTNGTATSNGVIASGPHAPIRPPNSLRQNASQYTGKQ